MSILGYIIDADDFERMRKIASRLQGGTDRERDEGHKLWLILSDAEKNPVRGVGDVDGYTQSAG